eukprot:scaffold37605_cov62-Phaeocystis_antarctica.AAC.4
MCARLRPSVRSCTCPPRRRLCYSSWARPRRVRHTASKLHRTTGRPRRRSVPGFEAPFGNHPCDVGVLGARQGAPRWSSSISTPHARTVRPTPHVRAPVVSTQARRRTRQRPAGVARGAWQTSYISTA